MSPMMTQRTMSQREREESAPEGGVRPGPAGLTEADEVVGGLAVVGPERSVAAGLEGSTPGHLGRRLELLDPRLGLDQAVHLVLVPGAEAALVVLDAVVRRLGALQGRQHDGSGGLQR